MNVIVIGAREDGHAKVVASIILQLKKFKLVGFVDDDASKKGKKILGKPVLGGMNDLKAICKKNKITGAIVAIGDNKKRRELAALLQASNIKLINAIHPTVHLDPDVRVGAGNYFGQGVIIITGSVIGNCVNLHTGTTIDHDNIIEDGANLGPGVHTAGRVKIRQNAFLGTGTIVIPDVEIGESVVAGAGTVIISNLKANSKVVGNPAREL